MRPGAGSYRIRNVEEAALHRLDQSPTDPNFVQNPYPFYDKARTYGDIIWWNAYDAPAAVSHRAVTTILKDRRFGRERDFGEIPPRLQPFYDIEAHSMLELDPPRHTRLRGLVLRAFTSRAIAALEPDITALCDALIDRFPSSEPFDLLTAYAQDVPVLTIARLLGVEDHHAPQLLHWSNAMVKMYQVSRTKADEDAAVQASTDFTAWMADLIAQKRQTPGDDLLTRLIEAQDDGDRLSTAELTSTAILLLNAGHEATVHTLGNAVKTALTLDQKTTDPKAIEEHLRYDPPLHLFSRWALEDVDIFDTQIRKGQRVDCLLAAAGHDPAVFPNPTTFDPTRHPNSHAAFGGGLHFCVGAPLARMELRIAMGRLFTRCPTLTLTEQPSYADIYHFHGLSRLLVNT